MPSLLHLTPYKVTMKLQVSHVTIVRINLLTSPQPVIDIHNRIHVPYSELKSAALPSCVHKLVSHLRRIADDSFSERLRYSTFANRGFSRLLIESVDFEIHL